MTLNHWLDRVLYYGESVLSEPLPHDPSSDQDAAALLARAFERHRLEVAGPPLEFDPTIALAAARCLADACWNLVTPEPTEGEVFSPGEPNSAAAHLSADVTLRFLPAVYARAFAHHADGSLVKNLATILRTWPLSGVLAKLDEPPITEPTFNNHAGLQLLYAERLADHMNPNWVPRDPAVKERIQLVLYERGRRLSLANSLESSRD